MARAVTHRTWYRIALGREGHVPLIVAAQGEHLGVAVALAEKHADGSFAIAAQVAKGNDIPLGESLGKHQVVAIGEAADLVPVFPWPSGVLPELGQTDAVLGIKRGFVLHPEERSVVVASSGGDTKARSVIEVVPERDELVETFLEIAERLPSGDNLEVRVLDHFEDAGTTDVWLTSRVNTQKIVRFLDDHDVELLGNGHVELSIYLRSQHATLRLTEHKTIVWIADDRSLEADIIRWLGELELPRLDAPGSSTPLVTIAAAPHFHYRPAKSRDRKKLGEQLYRQRLRRVDTLRASAADAAR